MSNGDTIAAIATGAGAGGIGVVRLSGPRAIDIACEVLGHAELPARQVVVARARDASGEVIDRVIGFAMPAPHSYTGENVAELQGHGGVANMAVLLAAVVARGARLATPGEFTRRAFDNGKVDLTQAEALLSVIGASSDRALRVAQAQLEGSLGRTVEALHERLLSVLAEVEATIDFPEEDLRPSGGSWIHRELDALGLALRGLSASFASGRALTDGLEVALVGPVNAGKSSLINALIGRERVLVAATPGTTRDVVEVRAVWNGVPVTLLDTAGERDAIDDVEQRGIALGRGRASGADVVVVVNDGVAPWDDGARFGTRVVVAQSKVDLGGKVVDGAIATSAKAELGLAELRAAVLAAAGVASSDSAGEQVVVTVRQRELLARSAQALATAQIGLAAATATEVVALDLREAMDCLAAVTGREVTEDMLDALFARFCIGK